MPGKNTLGSRAANVTMGHVVSSFRFRSWLVALGGLAIGLARLGAAEEAVNYSARPVLRQLVLGGNAMVPRFDPPGEPGGETAYRGLSFRPGELPLEIHVGAEPGA